MRVWALILLAALCLPCVSKEVQKAENAASKASAEQRGSKSNPVFIQLAPSKDAEDRAKKDEDERSAKQKADADLVAFTGKLADYTNDLAIYVDFRAKLTPLS